MIFIAFRQRHTILKLATNGASFSHIAAWLQEARWEDDVKRQIGFSVESNAIIIEAIEACRDYTGADTLGMRMGLDMIRRGLAEIGQIALRLDDPELTAVLIRLCVLRQSKEGAPLRVLPEARPHRSGSQGIGR